MTNNKYRDEPAFPITKGKDKYYSSDKGKKILRAKAAKLLYYFSKKLTLQLKDK